MIHIYLPIYFHTEHQRIPIAVPGDHNIVHLQRWDNAGSRIGRELLELSTIHAQSILLVPCCIEKRKKFHRQTSEDSARFNCLFEYPFAQVLSLAHDICLEFRKYFDGEHRNNCRKRHQLLEKDEAQLCTSDDTIHFRILHFYSPVHYKVELFDENRSPVWDSQSRSRIVEVHLTKTLPHGNDRDPWRPEVFHSIFNRINDPDERFECYTAKPIIKLREIIFIDQMQVWHKQNSQTARDQPNGMTLTFINDPRLNLSYSPGVISKCLDYHIVAGNKVL